MDQSKEPLMEQSRAPLYEALRDRRLRGEASFHVPGHKFGQGLGLEEKGYFGSVMELDYTEIEGLDDLHHPHGVIAQAQQLAAACFGSDEAFFLVGGSTVGNLAVLASVCRRGELLLVQRNAHKSVIHGLMLAGAEAVFLEPQVDGLTGISAGVSLGTLQAALELYPQAKGVFLTNPNYYGMGRDLEEYVRLVHDRGLPLLVDEAHGAHFGFHHGVPPSALSRGADAVVQSTHKMLTAMTMGAMLHVQGERLDRRRLKEQLVMLQSSSPSYPLLASLDLARRKAAVSGGRLLEEALERISSFKKAYLREDGQAAADKSPAYDYADPFKLVFYDPAGLRSGIRLQEELGRRGIVAEMADERNVVLACSLATTQGDLQRLEQALQGMSVQLALPDCPLPSVPRQQAGGSAGDISSPLLMEPGDNREEAVAVSLEAAAGRRAAEAVVPYPPGIPLLFPGELIRPRVVEHIRRLVKAGVRFQGMQHVGPGCSILVKKDLVER